MLAKCLGHENLKRFFMVAPKSICGSLPYWIKILKYIFTKYALLNMQVLIGYYSFLHIEYILAQFFKKKLLLIERCRIH